MKKVITHKEAVGKTISGWLLSDSRVLILFESGEITHLAVTYDDDEIDLHFVTPGDFDPDDFSDEDLIDYDVMSAAEIDALRSQRRANHDLWFKENERKTYERLKAKFEGEG